MKKQRKKKSPSERPKKVKPEPKRKSRVWRRAKNPRKKKKKKEGEADNGFFELGDMIHDEEDSDDAGLTDTQIMQRELEKIPYFRDPAFRSSFHMERSTFQVF